MGVEFEIIQLWVGAIAVVASVVALATVVSWSRIDRTRWAHVGRTNRVSTSVRDTELERGASDRLLAPVLDSLADQIAKLLQPAWVDGNQTLLERAGPQRFMTARRLLTLKLLAVPVGALLGSFIASGQPKDLRLLIAVALAIFLNRLPNLWLRRAGSRRSAQITRELPDILDQITISVGAGLGLDAAMGRVAQRSRGILGHELTRTMQDIRIGIDRPVALENLARRTDSEDVSQLVSSLLQGIEMGMPLAPVLEARAAELRRKRRANAEERAHKLSVKMTFPTAVCILPALLLVVIGPAVLSMMESNFGG